MYGIRFVVKECNQWEEFGEGSCNNILEFFAGDAVELVGEVKENGSTSRERLGALWEINIFLDSKLHCFDNEVCAIRDTDSKIER